MRRFFCIFLTAVMLFCSAVLPASAVNKSELPTLYIDNAVWYKYLLFPLAIKNGEYCIPISMLSAVPGFSYRFDEETSCLLIEDNNGNYLSILPKSGVGLDKNGNRKNIVSFIQDNEIYISSDMLTSVFGIIFEKEKYNETEMLRLCTISNLLPFTDIIKASVTGESEFLDHTASQGNEVIKYGNVFSVVADISVLNIDTITTILDVANKLSITVTFAVSSEFISGEYNIPLLTEIAAGGHSFALLTDNKSDLSLKNQYEIFSERLDLLFRKTSKLVIGENNKVLTSDDCIFLDKITDIDEISDVKTYNYENSLVRIDGDDVKNLSLLTALIINAIEKGITVTAVNPHTGN